MNLIIEDLQENIQFNNDLKNVISISIESSLKYEKVDKECEIGVMLVDDIQIQELNKMHRNIDSPTDVLSFPLIDFNNEDDEQFSYHDQYLMLGDIVINLQRALEQSKEYEHSFEREVGYLCVHSVLHLLGYDHDNDDNTKMMRLKEEEILESINLTRE